MTHPISITLPSDREIRIERAFDAPAVLVFRAWNEPALFRRWMVGPPGWTMKVCEIEARVGAEYRVVWGDAEGASFTISGVFIEVEAPQRWVTTERFEGFEGESVNSVELIEADGRTNVIQIMAYPTKEARDAALQSGMAEGCEACYANLDLLFAEGAIQRAG